jgi:glycosyltransferase involved in cell wall biosynthesis
VYEVLAGSSRFRGKNKNESRVQTGMTGEFNFIWVGNLDANKDPMTVLDAFEKYSHFNTGARLYMIFQGGNLLEDVKKKISGGGLEETVILVGKVEHAQLEYWYSSAEYFISASHREGGSYALTEAMACGCMPIVTRIPAAMKVIEEGKAGYHFSPGNAHELFMVLSSLNKEQQTGMSEKIAVHFKNNFSPGAIAKKIQSICRSIKE